MNTYLSVYRGRFSFSFFFCSVVFSEVKDVHNEYRLAKRAYLISKVSHQRRGVAITLRMRTTISPRQVSGNHGQLFRPHQHNTSDIYWYFQVEQRAGDCKSFVGWTQKLHVDRLSIVIRVLSNHWKRRQSHQSITSARAKVWFFILSMPWPQTSFFLPRRIRFGTRGLREKVFILTSPKKD